ncbi:MULTISPECIES: tRNA (N6-threonylcarbamoyladenosine(37)-N6)-methyltransferase TrmO [unclassified Fibrobacter]|uniref:tRNA (N6-threonylcarbamoyladenosine(37)-N6)-methyltransferase TrmO n=1 Tax=unclassified Fibrobacter TaxID=2634177 RepID=UPI000D6A83B7|nr:MULTISPECIES: tRNA (N6-threonylcarbamoyladenosine(37)-N6)-methyltransferase TrmO [unclassified Fibrobacter]PWJ68271.1 tRNA-Thr(GGU) m(6)t(6)A37 methyltransferase TsaA [Fibrobacter sp. UWR4]PZW72629.1 tRNA-Thr(GGU) m(6)t(6)A37 methyltransferase TsaA [Fibrobacter sp. UWR1]
MTNPSEYNFKVIAKIKSDFPDKFGIPRQSGLLKELRSAIRFEPEYRIADALRGLEGFSHLWILWIFSENVRTDENGENRWSPTVRPPRLGGNKRLGVFATRSSFRPNPLAMSCVKIEEIHLNITDGDYSGPEIIVSGADLMDGTPIVDVKPYLPYADCIENAAGGFAHEVLKKSVKVEFPEELKKKFPSEKLDTLIEILAEDPRPAYQKNPDRIYGFGFAGYEIKFKVENDILTILDVIRS